MFDASKTAFRMPALLTKELFFCEKAANEGNLLDLLVKRPPDLIAFFEVACADETWCEQYSGFMRKILGWITFQAFQDKLLMDLCKKAVKAIQAHFFVLEPMIPYNIMFKLKDANVHVNSLLFSVASPFFRELFLREIRDKNKVALAMPDISQSTFRSIEEYVNTGQVANLWRMGEQEILYLMKQGQQWNIPDFTALCEKSLARYFTKENVFDLFFMAHEGRLPILKDLAIEFINSFNESFKLIPRGLDRVAFEFIQFSESALKNFELFRNKITDLICTGTLSESDFFSVVVNQCPKMTFLDISGSRFFMDTLLEIPKKLDGLDLSRCSWLNQENLKKLSQICTHLQTLHLGSNTQLNSAAWGELIRFKQLRSLDLYRCLQINDEDFLVILKSCSSLVELGLEGCVKIGEKGIDELTKFCAGLTRLNISRTRISDSALLQIASRCKNLLSLDLTRCERISEKGITEAIKHGNSLRELVIAQCAIPQAAVDGLRKLHPYLSIVT